MPRRDAWERAAREKCTEYVEKLEDNSGRRQGGRCYPVNSGQVIR